MKLDVKEIIRSKAPGLEKVPLLVNYLKKLAHQDELNYFLENYTQLGPIGFIRASLKDMGVSYSQNGMEKLDPSKRYIFASNHPFGGLDGMALADEVTAYFGDVRVVVNDLLMNVTPLRPIFVPINKLGGQNEDYFQLYNEAFESNIPIITFPAGLVSRKKGGIISDMQWKSSFVRQAVINRRDIVPVYFEGGLSSFFYRLANIRTALGIKVNIEMLYLADEMFKQKGKHLKIEIGEPVEWQSLKGMRATTASEMIRTKVYNLKI